MTRTLTRILLPAVLALTLAAPAHAAVDGTVMELDIIQQGDGMIAVVILDHMLGLPMDLDLTYEVNGQTVKVEPAQVFGPTAYVEFLGPSDQLYTVCASIEGVVQVIGDQYRPTEHQRCDIHFPAPAAGSLTGDLAQRSDRLQLPTGVTSPEQPVDRREARLAVQSRR